MSPNHRYQVMPDLSPEEYTALKADIDAHGVRIPIEVDEEGNIIDGFTRKQICDELGIDCPTNPFFGHTEEEKREHAWRLNLMRRHVSPEQKRELARRWREEGWTHERIAVFLGISPSTVGNWLHEFTNSGELHQPNTAQGRDGKLYPGRKTRRRAGQPPEGETRSEMPQSPSDPGDGLLEPREQQETPQLRGTDAEARSPGTEPLGGSDAPGAPETPPQAADEPRVEAGERPSLALEAGPGPSAEDDAKGWVNALQDLFAKLETLQAQGRLLPPSTDWPPDTGARGLATIRRIQGICSDLAAVVEADMSEADVLAALPRGESPEAVPGAAASLTERSGRAHDADPLEPCSPEVKAVRDVAPPATPHDPCGWCGSTEVAPLDSTHGRLHCQACHAVYNPRTDWAPGDRDKQQRPPASLPATAA